MDGIAHTDRTTGKSIAVIDVQPVGEYIAEDMHRLGLDRQQLADAAGLGVVTVARIMEGYQPVMEKEAASLGRVLGRDPLYFWNLDTFYRLTR